MFRLKTTAGQSNRTMAALVCSVPLVPGALFLGFAIGDGIAAAATAAIAIGASGFAVVHKAVQHIESHYARKLSKA